MEDDTLETIDRMRARLDEIWDKMTVGDFRRLHAKFFGCILSVETGFQRRFPKQWVEYEKEFYKDTK